MIKIADHTLNRVKLSLYSIGTGLLLGLFNAFHPPIDFSFSPEFFGLLTAAVMAVVILHEGVHGAVAVFYRLKPLFGLQPPLVYVTFTEKIRRGHFIAIALAPLVVLNTLFGICFAFGFFKVFSYFCIMINSLGAVGDIWMTFKLLPYERDVLVQDTKTGIEIWKAEAS